MKILDCRLGWSDREKHELLRLHQAFPQPDYEIDCGTSDRRDPWCVVTRSLHEEIIVHIARINRQYVVAIGDDKLCRPFERLSDAIYFAIQQNRSGASWPPVSLS